MYVHTHTQFLYICLLRGPTRSNEYTYSPDFGFKISFTAKCSLEKSLIPGLGKRRDKPGISCAKR